MAEPTCMKSDRRPGRETTRGRMVLIASTVAFVLAWLSASHGGSTLHADRWLVDFAVHHRTVRLTDLARTLTRLGSAVVVVPVTVVACATFAVRRHFRMAILIAASTAITATAVMAVKYLVPRSGPTTPVHLVLAVGRAFPSGHAAQSVACYAALAWIFTRTTDSPPKRVAAWATATGLALGVGWSRIYLAVHWPTDVVAGWALAASVLASLSLVEPIVRHQRSRNPSER